MASDKPLKQHFEQTEQYGLKSTIKNQENLNNNSNQQQQEDIISSYDEANLRDLLFKNKKQTKVNAKQQQKQSMVVADTAKNAYKNANVKKDTVLYSFNAQMCR